MKRLLFMVVVTIVVLGSFARPEKDTSATPTRSNAIKNRTKNITKNITADESAAQYKKG
jgi:hypothetical protein